MNLLPYLSGKNSGHPHETLYWRIDGMWAIRHGDWKLVHGRADDTAPELFDLAADSGEQNNLALAKPEKVPELRILWNTWNSEQAPPTKSQVKAGKRAKKAVAKVKTK